MMGLFSLFRVGEFAGKQEINQVRKQLLDFQRPLILCLALFGC
jgi:hypothetical protein